MKADLDGSNPDEYCEKLLDFDLTNLAPLEDSQALYNPLGANGTAIPWPTKILDNKCDWFPCADLSDCPSPEDGTCPSFEPPHVQPVRTGAKAPKAPKEPKKTAEKGTKAPKVDEPKPPAVQHARRISGTQTRLQQILFMVSMYLISRKHSNSFGFNDYWCSW